MSLLDLKRGPEVNLPSTINNGTIWLCTDTGNFYIDIDGKRIQPNHGVISGASAHNKIFRGKYLGTSITDDQYAAIANGTFNDLYVGDYWNINDTYITIGGFDYYLDYPASGVTQHHILAFTGDGSLPEYHMGDLCGYADSDARGLFGVDLSSIFGSHLGTFNTVITNAITGNPPLESSVIQVTTTSEMFKGCMVMNSDQISNYNSFKSQVVLDSIIEKSVVPYFQDLPGRADRISEANYYPRFFRDFFLQDFAGYSTGGTDWYQAIMDSSHIEDPNSSELGASEGAANAPSEIVNYFLIV